MATDEKLLACITTKTENVNGDDAKYDDLYQVGTIVNIKRMMRNEGIMQLVVQGMDRFEIVGGVLKLKDGIALDYEGRFLRLKDVASTPPAKAER